MQEERYPTAHEFLGALGCDAIVVGSAATKPTEICKDIDLVVSVSGWNRIQSQFGYWLVSGGHSRWGLFLQEEPNSQVIEVFAGICNIQDKTKHEDRVTYEDACKMDLKVVDILGVEMLALASK